MLFKSLIKPKKDLTTVREDITLEEALKVLEESGFRCVPILDKTGQIFRGNIYKMHIYRHKSRGGEICTCQLRICLKMQLSLLHSTQPSLRFSFPLKIYRTLLF